MITSDVRGLLGKAHPYLTQHLHGAAGFAIARNHYEVTLEHLLLKLQRLDVDDLRAPAPAAQLDLLRVGRAPALRRRRPVEHCAGVPWPSLARASLLA